MTNIQIVLILVALILALIELHRAKWQSPLILAVVILALAFALPWLWPPIAR